ncbi:MAG: nucleoside 2-deoxyribosyltransferase [Pseudomonadota bacterium]
MLEIVLEEEVSFGKIFNIEILLKKINKFLENLYKFADVTKDSSIRLYATGIFQRGSKREQTELVIQTFVNFGLYFNIIQADLEQFYLEKSMSVHGYENIMEGIISQEFRKVVVAGSIQNELENIRKVMNTLQKHNITILFPLTTNVVPKTLGTDFLLLEGQKLKNRRDGWRLQYEQMEKYKQADAIIVCNPGGLTGQGVVFELGFMVAISKRIIFVEKPKNLSIKFPYEVGLNF